MKYLLNLFLFGLIPFFSACRQTPLGPPVLERQQYTLTGGSRCDTTANKGVDVSVSYVLLKEDTDGAHRINDTLQQLAVGSITGWLDSTTVAAHPEARTDLARAASLFATDYHTMTQDMGGLGGCWELKTQADTLYASDDAVTVQMETYAYTGGAHPNTNLAFYTFDRESGRALSLNDLVTDTTALLNVVEQSFRRQQGLLPQTNLEERGYFLRDGRFFLPANIGMSRKGLVFYYNPYEIAAYALGPIEVTVPYDQLSGILRAN
ncbi:DUF3298 and DUF4163 domain-containing protein [Spirosoma utsteinense]|uniref:DUF3298 domain-containing protein n=1 Tax=Spirosoma utsteinense TaxID=2585773 RepID=A0ABR6W059_9BACT|nr:DUF3298 and DUF4163 domain-containing protein [Spirosoma utsteinense]MBC3786542.1 hypothetical protein [Spirosoma utsteinense]MBC3789920.1 hypothetical protein [Spirosoma utsteinense]